MVLKNTVYDYLKWTCLIGIPAASVLYAGIAKIWGLPFVTEVIGTLDAVGVFLGTLIGISNAGYKNNIKVGGTDV